MNKTFNDPNVKYSDQGTPLAQAAEALSTIGEVTEAVDDLTETVDDLSEKVDLIPVPVAADEGKVLTATDDGAYELADVDALPAIGSGDAGKVLTVNAGETGAEWAVSGQTMHVFEIYSKSIPQSITTSFTIEGTDLPADLTLDNIASLLDNGIIPVILLHGLNSSGQTNNRYHVFILSEHPAKGGEVFAVPYVAVTAYTGYAKIESVRLILNHSNGVVNSAFVQPTSVQLQIYSAT